MNPYNYNLPVGPEMFFGRDADAQSLVRYLTTTPGDSVALVGGRRMGKTSLLEAVARLLDAQRDDALSWMPIVIFLDFTGEGINSAADFFFLVARQVEELLAGQLDQSPEPFQLADAQPPAPAFRQQLKRWDRLLWLAQQRHLRLILLLDECEQIVTRTWAADLQDALRYLLVGRDTRPLLKVVMTGAHQFLVAVRQHGSPLRNILVYHLLRVLDQEAIQALAERPGRITLSPNVLELLIRQGGGHPFLSQYLLHHLWKKGLAQCTPADVEQIAAAFPHQRGDFWDWMKNLGVDAGLAYQLLATTTGSLPETIIRQTMQPIPENLSQSLDALLYHGLLDHHLTGYRVTSEMFRTWFLSNWRVALPTPADRHVLQHALIERFNDAELRDLCFTLNIDYESLPGEGKASKARELVAWCVRHNRLQELAVHIQQLRP